MKKNTRKGFTITELVIVIAVIAILAAVLIPTFAGIIKRAEESTITQETRAAVTVLLGEKNGSIPAGTYIIYFDGHLPHGNLRSFPELPNRNAAMQRSRRFRPDFRYSGAMSDVLRH